MKVFIAGAIDTYDWHAYVSLGSFDTSIISLVD